MSNQNCLSKCCCYWLQVPLLPCKQSQLSCTRSKCKFYFLLLTELSRRFLHNLVLGT
jgi:hypothetical protein